MGVTDVRLTDRPGSKAEIAYNVFGVVLQDDQLERCQPYFDYYNTEIELLYAGVARETQQITNLPVRNYEDIHYVINVLKHNMHSTRSHLRKILERRFHSVSPLQLNRCINLGIRLWLMINVQDVEFQTLRNEATCVSWGEESSLQDLVDSLFPRATWKVNAGTSRLGPYFTVAYLRKVCGLKVEWTTSIYDHLKLDHDKMTLQVFPFKCHVERLIACHDNRQAVPIPREVLWETLLSLDLLFPIWNKDTQILLKQEKKTFHMQGPFSMRAISLFDFQHWRDRLLELHEVLLAPPVSWAQLWRDRRNPQQFWTFWIALVILFLTVISTVTGCIQAWASIQALK